MALIKYTNSWVDVIDANDILSDEFTAGTWSTISDVIKAQLLVTAFNWMYHYPYFAIPKDISGMTDPQKSNIEFAQSKLAMWYYNYGLTHEQRMAIQADGVESFRLSTWSEKLDKKLTDLPQFVLDILNDELINKGGYIFTVDRDITR
jgi:hypothetical protein